MLDVGRYFKYNSKLEIVWSVFDFYKGEKL